MKNINLVKLIIGFLSLFFAFLNQVQAENLNLCRSPYALCSNNFNYGKYKKETRDVGDFKTTFLWNTFNENCKNGIEEMQRPVVTGVELALFNTTCVSNGNCGKYETLHGYTASSLNNAIGRMDEKLKGKIVKESERAAAFILSNLPEGKSCKLNPFLEHRLSRDNYTRAVSWIAPAFKGRCDIVWNPVGGNPGGPQSPAVIMEGHGDAPKLSPRCVANPDGTTITPDAYPGYLLQYGKFCEMACSWGPNDNCRSSDDRTSVDPRQRTCKETKDFERARNAMRQAIKLNVDIPEWSAEDNKSLDNCKKVFSNPDGPKEGFLSKETDDVHKNAWTVLLPTLKNKKGEPINYKKFESLKAGKAFYGWGANNSFLYTEDKSNRPVWRACTGPRLTNCKTPREAPFNIVLQATTPKGEKHCWKVSNPRIRND